MGKQKPRLGLGLIGAGFMGKTHCFGYATAAKVFDLPCDIHFAGVAEATPALAEAAQTRFAFARATTEWQTLIDDPAIDLIDITVPNAFHKEIALAALAAGKHVYCEKPLAPTAHDSQAMAAAADKADVSTQVGFNYLANPLLHTAKAMIEAGELGEIRSYRGIHSEDYMADANMPWTWRHDAIGGGALADLGSHALATAIFLLGPVARILGDVETVIPERRDVEGVRKSIEVDDIARAFVRFASGASGTIEASWTATGQKMQHDFEIYGSKGALRFSQDRLNELDYFDTRDPADRQGFRKIVSGPRHPPYGQFCPAPGHQLGFNDLKVIEIAHFIQAIAGEISEPFNFRRGHHIQNLVDTIQMAAKQGHWVDVEHMPW